MATARAYKDSQDGTHIRNFSADVLPFNRHSDQDAWAVEKDDLRELLLSVPDLSLDLNLALPALEAKQTPRSEERESQYLEAGLPRTLRCPGQNQVEPAGISAIYQ